MNHHSQRILGSLALFAFVATASSAQVGQLLPAQEGDLVTSRVMAGDFAKAMMTGVSREPVTFTMPLAQDAEPAAIPAPFVAKSREYSFDVTADELRKGAKFFVTSPNALVRVHPAAGLAKLADGVAINPASLVLSTADGEFANGAGMKLLVDADQLKASGAPFAEGTSAFRIAAELGVGEMTLRAPLLKSAARYSVHVFETDSDLALEMSASKVDYLHGQVLRIEASLGNDDRKLALDRMDGYVTSPAGRAWPVTFRAQGAGHYAAELRLDAAGAFGQGLWQVHMAASAAHDGLQVVRNARTSFACHLPTAALLGDAHVIRGRDGLRASLGLEVGSEGRYEVRGTLYGSDRGGKMRPIAISHSADWLSAGSAKLELSFGADVLRKSGLEAPFEIRDLRLLDQGRMGLLHRQARALTLAD